MDKTTTRIGMIGAGLMGHGIALNLLRHGYRLAVLDHPGNQPVEDLLRLGAEQVGTASALAARSKVLILCVTGTPQVEDVLFRHDGVLAGLQPGTVIIDCSTAMPSSTHKIAQAIEQAGGQFLDAPMTRTPKEAAEGRLNLIVGGPQTLYERCLPLLRCYAEHICYAGPTGSGHRLKLLHNFVSLGFSAVLAEAAACAARTGMDRNALLEVLTRGGGAGVVLERLRPYIESGDPSGFRFSIANALKDMGYYTAMAEQADCPSRTAQAVRQTYQSAADAGHDQALIPALIAYLTESPSSHIASQANARAQ